MSMAHREPRSMGEEYSSVLRPINIKAYTMNASVN